MGRAALVRRQLEAILVRLRPDALARGRATDEPGHARDAFRPCLADGARIQSAGSFRGARGGSHGSAHNSQSHGPPKITLRANTDRRHPFKLEASTLDNVLL